MGLYPPKKIPQVLTPEEMRTGSCEPFLWAPTYPSTATVFTGASPKHCAALFKSSKGSTSRDSTRSELWLEHAYLKQNKTNTTTPETDF